MGYLLKEALKNLCGVNQWTYAVFWKVACLNPKLLIWEECYYEPASCFGHLEISGKGISAIPYLDYSVSSISTETHNSQCGAREGNQVHLLLNKMMMDNRVIVVGEGLVGRVAATGNHQWVASENYYREIHSPEVLKEVCLQFSAGMQTVAVVPILPYGVAQFGSYLPIQENIGFVNTVVSLIAELECVPGVLQSANDEVNELAPEVGFPYSTLQELPLESNMHGASSFFNGGLNYVGCTAQTSAFDSHIPFPLVGEFRNEMQSCISDFQASNSSSFHNKPNDCHMEAETSRANKLDFSFPKQFMNRLAKAEVIPSNSIAQTNQYSPLNITERKILSDKVSVDHFIKPVTACIQVSEVNSGLAYCAGSNDLHVNKKFEQGELSYHKEEMKQKIVLTDKFPLTEHTGKLKVAEAIPGFFGDDTKLKTEGQCHTVNNTKRDAGFESPSDDLFAILGIDFKDKWLISSRKSCLNDQSATTMHNCGTIDSSSKNDLASSELYFSNQGKSDSGIVSFPGTSRLLDDIVSKVHPFTKQSFDYDSSSSTALNDTSSSSVSNALLPYGRIEVSDNVKGDLLGMPDSTSKAGMICSSSLTTSLKEDLGIRGQGSSSCALWAERGHNIRQSNIVATGYSTKSHESSKTNRKRLKPGENPRPRPKDRQMIQDRVKELRKIVPNGAKCSIDALLERTIKHMLFMQSVTKHAEKLKKNVESKITSNDGGLPLKDDFGGATWAYEVGSQSMMCPIIVEDLNEPHQMLVEMLCEERGLFLEIADVIRGLGLTILKGIMETRSDKIWSRFAVEADKNVTRMEIFVSLVRLLEQNAKTGAPKSNSTTNNTTVQEIHKAASLPASGGSHNDLVC